MMDIHPHWQSTGEQGFHVPVGHSSVSRRPAALVGIALVVALGITVVHGIPSFSLSQPESALSGTVSPPPPPPSDTAEIHITDHGPVPASITVRPGQEITWFNDQTAIPHILESETLRGADGALLYTPAIFPGNSAHFSIARNMEPGAYPYDSTTSDAVAGTVVVVADAGTPVAAPAAAGPIAPATNAQNNNDGAAPLIPRFPDDSGGHPGAQPTPPQNQDALLPHNPYMIGSARAHPFDLSGNPVGAAAPSRSVRHAGAPRQPETGASLWIAVTLSLGIFLIGWLANRSQEVSVE